MLVLMLAGASWVQGQTFPEPYDTEKTEGGPMEAERVAGTMDLPPGFRAQVYASEPDVRQPIAITTDVRGRLWVAENYTFAELPARWDKGLRDRVLILEDRDGDGRADHTRVFWDEGRFLTSLETGMGGVWALCPPNLLFIPDRDGDDTPDGPPEIVLDGFNNTALVGHNIANGLKWGPDGWLYGRHGFLDNSLVGRPGTPAEKRSLFNCAIWRYHPTRQVFEVVTQGTTNPWGMDFDEHGQMFFVNVNIGHVWHGIPGACYRRSHSTGHFNPYVYDSIDQAADHYHYDTGVANRHSVKGEIAIREGGGHAHTGCLIYQGGRWPGAYHNSLLTVNFLGRRVNRETLHREGNGYVARHAEDLLQVHDEWFRGIEIISGPDGNVFLADWSDAGECHDNNEVHRSSGRIYKISHGPEEAAAPFDLESKSDGELVELLGHQNDWFPRAVRKILQARAAAGQDMGDTRAKVEAILHSQQPERLRLRALWAWHSIGAGDQRSLLRLTEDASEPVRTWAVRLLSECDGPLEPATVDRLVSLAGTESSGLVRLFLATILPRLPSASRWKLATALSLHDEDAGDRQQPLMIWYGIEPLVVEDTEAAFLFLAKARLPKVRRHVARRLMEEGAHQPELVDRLVAVAAGAGTSLALQEDVVAGMADSMRGMAQARKPPAWDELAASLNRSDSQETKRMVQDLDLLFGSGRAESDLLALVEDTGGDATLRSQALASLLANSKTDHRPLLERHVTDRGTGRQAVRGLGRYGDEKVPELLLGRYARVTTAVQAEIVEVLISRPAFALRLLEEIGKGTLPRSIITPFQARQIHDLGDAELQAGLAEVWGTVRTTPAEKHAEIEALRRRLTAGHIASGDPGKGRRIYANVCGACHKLYGEGGDLGPDLTGSGRQDLNFLLEKIVDPAAVVPNELRMTMVKLRDGRVLAGRVSEENDQSFLLQTPSGRLRIHQADVLSREFVEGSMMPEGLLRQLSDEETRDLFHYLMGASRPEMAD